MRIMIVTDAWFPQTNGVVNTLAQTAANLMACGTGPQPRSVAKRVRLERAA